MTRLSSLVLAAACLGSLLARTAEAQETSLAALITPPDVTMEYDHSVPLAGRTYSWGEVKLAVPQYSSTVHAAVDGVLRKKGWQLLPSGGSVTVFAYGDIRGEAQITAAYSALGGGWEVPWGAQGFGPGWKPFYGEAVLNALNIPENNLVLDMFDTGNHRLLFRGVMEDDLSGTEKKTTKLLTKTVKRLLAKFPPKK